MSRVGRFNPFSRLRRAMAGHIIRLLTKPLDDYTLHIPNDFANLKRQLRKGDVLLVEGNERISECIKYLTQSSWSHSTLYVGDEPLRRDPASRPLFIEKYGEDTEFLLVEALVESGVVLSPLSKYRDFNIRVCRPHNLSTADLSAVLDEALTHVGDTYDIRNIVDLARYFLPVTLVPRRLRHHALNFGSGEPTRVICSSLIAECFNRVRFPVVPRFLEPPEPVARGAGWRGMISFQPKRYGVMERVSPTLVTPRDFDLSPYFEIIKFNGIEGLRFNYHRIQWADEEQDRSAAEKQA